MIIAYKRPKTTEEARALLLDQKINPIVLAGGTYPDEFVAENLTGVDVQELEFNQVIKNNEGYSIGGLITIQRCADALPEFYDLEKASKIEGGRNIRNSRTLHQHLFFSKGRSALASILLAMDVKLVFLPETNSLSLSDFFEMRAQYTNRLIKWVNIAGKPRVVFESIARSPLDLPLLIVAIAVWPEGRIRAVVGGFGEAPQLVFDGTDQEQLLLALCDKTTDADDQWASAIYRQDTAAILIRRCLQRVESNDASGEL